LKVKIWRKKKGRLYSFVDTGYWLLVTGVRIEYPVDHCSYKDMFQSC